MTPAGLSLTVPGHPIPKGSMKCIGTRGGRGHQLIEANRHTTRWRTLVAAVAKAAETTPAQPGGPLVAVLTFRIPRPKKHHRSGDPERPVRPDAPTHPTSYRTGDLDKLTRLILDALQDAGVYPDDAAVVRLYAMKEWATHAQPAGVTIHLSPIHPQQEDHQ